MNSLICFYHKLRENEEFSKSSQEQLKKQYRILLGLELSIFVMIFEILLIIQSLK
jgi:hypothetical protein